MKTFFFKKESHFPFFLFFHKPGSKNLPFPILYIIIMLLQIPPEEIESYFTEK